MHTACAHAQSVAGIIFHAVPHPLQTSFRISCNEVLPEWISLKTDIWSYGAMVLEFFVGSRGPSSQREVCY